MFLRMAVSNVDAGGGNRLDSIITCIQSLETDILILDGFRTGINGMALRGHLDRIGPIYQSPCETEPGQDAVVLASRFPFVATPLPETGTPFAALLLHVYVAGYHVSAVGACPDEALDRLLDPVCAISRAWSGKKGIMLAGWGRVPTPLAECGLMDAWSFFHRGAGRCGSSDNTTFPVALVTRKLCAGLKAAECRYDPVRQGAGRHPILEIEIDAQTEP